MCEFFGDGVRCESQLPIESQKRRTNDFKTISDCFTTAVSTSPVRYEANQSHGFGMEVLYGDEKYIVTVKRKP